MRLTAVILLLCLPGPAAAWETTLGAVCVLRHDTPSAEVELTYDPGAPLYTITVTRKTGPWPDVPAFGIAFVGGAEMSIGTTRHTLSRDGHALTVMDRGFGNVLDGLQFNREARVIAGPTTEILPLDGAAGPVQAFRDCPPFSGS